MANPSDKGARGPAGPIAEPGRTGATAPSSTSSAGVSASAPSAGVSASAPSGSPKETVRRTTEQAGATLGEGLKERAGIAADAVRQQAGASLRDGLKETAQTAASAVRLQAAEFAEDVGHELNKTSEAQIARGVEAIRGVARAIDSAASELEKQSPPVARTVHEAARQVDGLSDNLSNRNVNELIDSAARLARARPALFFGGSIAAGFAFARFLKSSGRQRQSAGYDPYQR